MKHLESRCKVRADRENSKHRKMKMLSYKVTWSEENEAYVATVDGDQFQSLSGIDNAPEDALEDLLYQLSLETNT